MAFNDLRKNRAASLEALTKELNKAGSNQKFSDGDDRYWTPTKDKDGNASAVIRFLPASEGEDVPFVRIWDHFVKGPGGYYVEKSLTTIGKDDPMSEANALLWNSGIEDNKKIASARKRRLKFHSNIYVVSDKANPEAVGKVFLFAYGKKIFDKINDLAHPAFEDKESINAFDLWEGANFRLRVMQDGDYPSYDKSEFDRSSALLSDDEELEALWKSQYKLQDLIKESEFKSYDELKAKVEKALGEPGERRAEPSAPAPSYKEEEPETKPSKSIPAWDDDDDDDTKDFFAKLREE